VSAFRHSARVYWEDTDAGGIVFYANYLKFMERARTEWLSALGFDLAQVEREHGIAFAVHRADIEYRAPARLSDRLDVGVSLIDAGRARFSVDQDVRRGDTTLVHARITLACLETEAWRPARIPAPLAERLDALRSKRL